MMRLTVLVKGLGLRYSERLLMFFITGVIDARVLWKYD